MLTCGHTMFYIAETDYLVSSAVLKPRDVANLQAIMRLSDDFEIPI